MITKTKAYSVGDKVYATLEDAQKAELEALFVEIDREMNHPDQSISPTWTIPEICDAIVRRMDRFKDILGTTETSRPRARKVNKPKKKSTSERTTEILDQAAADGIRRQNLKFELINKSQPMGA